MTSREGEVNFNLRTIAIGSFPALALAIPFDHAAAQTVQSVAGTYILVTARSYGQDPRGTLTLGADGRYVIVLLRATLPKFTSGNRTKNTPEETKAIVNGSLAHFGTYTIDDGGKTLTMHIEASTFPNFDGTSQKRSLKVSGDLLTYTVASPSGGGKAGETVWRRVK